MTPTEPNDGETIEETETVEEHETVIERENGDDDDDDENGERIMEPDQHREIDDDDADS